MYMAECVRVCTENTARFAGGSSIPKKLSDILAPQAPKDERPAEEIVADILTRAEITFAE